MTHENGIPGPIDLVDVVFTDNGRSVRLEVIDTIPPYGTSYISLRNISQAWIDKIDGDEEYPLTIVDMSWKQTSSPIGIIKPSVLSEITFNGKRPQGELKGVNVRIDGAITGEVVCEEILFHDSVS